MSYQLSRLMSTATAGYGAYAPASPQHLGLAGVNTLAPVVDSLRND